VEYIACQKCDASCRNVLYEAGPRDLPSLERNSLITGIVHTFDVYTDTRRDGFDPRNSVKKVSKNFTFRTLRRQPET
jgi:hypothetical protein